MARLGSDVPRYRSKELAYCQTCGDPIAVGDRRRDFEGYAFHPACLAPWMKDQGYQPVPSLRGVPKPKKRNEVALPTAQACFYCKGMMLANTAVRFGPKGTGVMHPDCLRKWAIRKRMGTLPADMQGNPNH
jgi:hypothetical protein